jgi:hypothetical protein
VIDAVLIFVVLGAAILLTIETLRWVFRPEARRLRVIKKIGGRR